MTARKLRHCASCAAEMRPFPDGRRTGWVCPKCGEVRCRGMSLLLPAVAAAAAAFGIYHLWSLSSNAGEFLFLGGAWLAIILFVGINAFVVGYVCYWCIHNWRSPVRRAISTVVRKRTRDWEIDVPKDIGAGSEATIATRLYSALGGDRGVTLAQWTDCYVTFDTPEGEQEFAVPEEVYTSVTEGERGLLVTQGELFKHFIQGL